MKLCILMIFALCEMILAHNHDSKRQKEPQEDIPYDGWYNNLVHPDWGAIDSILLRMSPANYSDGVYKLAGQNRPSPSLISERVHKGPSGQGSYRDRSAMLVYFGQHVVQEIVDTERFGCPMEYHNIPVHNDDNNGNAQIPFKRSRYDSRTGRSPNNPRQQLNLATPFIDGSAIYGTSKTWTDSLRAFQGGRLKVDNPYKALQDQFPAENDMFLPFLNMPATKQHQMEPADRFFRIGNRQGFENPFLLSMSVLWFRWHNYLAANFSKNNAEWDDEKLFQMARRWVIAYQQKITMYDFLPRFLHIYKNNTFFEIPPYKMPDNEDNNSTKFREYRRSLPSDINPAISQEFQAAAMRFGHTLVPPGLWVRGPKQSEEDPGCHWDFNNITVNGQPHKVHAMRLCNTYWDSEDKVKGMFDMIVRGMASTKADAEDPFITPDLREYLYGPLEFSRRDLAAIDIQRGRDHGLADYNTVRKVYGLEPLNWTEINPTHCEETITRLQELYGNSTVPDNLDLIVGGLLETTKYGPGPLFQEIILDQFMRIRHGDRFWFESKNGLFTEEEIKEIKRITLKQIILKTTNIEVDELQDDVFVQNGTVCPQPYQLNASKHQNMRDYTVLENCTSRQTFSYISGSLLSFSITYGVLLLSIPVTFLIVLAITRKRKQQMPRPVYSNQYSYRQTFTSSYFDAIEWMGEPYGTRPVSVRMSTERKCLVVMDRESRVLRILDVKQGGRVLIRTSSDNLRDLLSVVFPGEIDLVLRFMDTDEREEFIFRFREFVSKFNVSSNVHGTLHEKMIMKSAKTVHERNKELDLFLKAISAEVFEKSSKGRKEKLLSKEKLASIQFINLTRREFADILGLKSKSEFVNNMFLLVDRDKNGLISFKEYLDFFVVLAKGDAMEKAELMFRMYDVDNHGYLSKQDFTNMIRSLMELSGSAVTGSDLDAYINRLYRSSQLPSNHQMTMGIFKGIFASPEFYATLNNASLPLDGGDVERDPQSEVQMRKKLFRSFSLENPDLLDQSGERKSFLHVETEETPEEPAYPYLLMLSRYLENNRLFLFWSTLYLLVVLGMFAEKLYHYTFETDEKGLWQLAGYGIPFMRGAASVLMFTFSSLILIMCKNTTTYLRSTVLHYVIPFDEIHRFHVNIAILALIFTVVHVGGSAFTLYCICTQPAEDLLCTFPEYCRFSHELPKFHYWAFETVTGMTGVILVIIIVVLYTFSLQYARTHAYKAFSLTHKLYVPLYALLVLHGSGKVVEMPVWHWFMVGPVFVFFLDKLISINRRKVQVVIESVELLPSNVVKLVIKRPNCFEFLSGQWARLACSSLGGSEFHPFTITSAPHEHSLTFHIRAIGPWTTNLRSTFKQCVKHDTPVILYMDGPYGEGHQDWYRYPVSVLIGGGIGVTPFASILKDITYRTMNRSVIPCKKVYFLWVTRTQEQFEWMTDIIKEVENKLHDRRIVDIHIFITQFRHKFDLRTTMLYICERHFQRLAGKSLMTGLKAVTHFGRPNFLCFLKSLHREHPGVDKIGVFSSGPLPIKRSVDQACADATNLAGYPIYRHQAEYF